MEILNNVITQRIIDEIREDDFYYSLEGVVVTGCEFGSLPGYCCHLLFIYNDKVCLKDYDTDENVCDSGMYIRKSEVGIHLLENKKTRTTMRGDYTFEQEVKYGTLLYDRNGNVEKLRESLLKEGTTDIDFWIGMCEFEPPIQYKKEQKSKKMYFCSFFRQKIKISTKKRLHLLILLAIINYV